MSKRSTPSPPIPGPVIRESPNTSEVWLSKTPMAEVMDVFNPSTESVAVVAGTSKMVDDQAVNSEIELVLAVSVIVKAEFVNDVLPTLPVALP